LKKSEREALLGQLAAGIAHEIRNPLNFISLSLSHLRNVPPEEQEVLITKIKEEIERINNLLNNFLNLGRELIINPVKIGIENLIEEVLTIISSKLKERGIEVIKDFSSPLPEVNIDIDKMKSCFLNILNNSIEAMPEGGKIKISIFKEDNFIVCKFADTGRGIKSDEMKHIFEPYFTTKPTGLGLGLAITQRIILAHGGNIDIESEFGKGTVVTLKLPL
jgi:signal transduction histidine kinase